ncbi:MAG: hypothetical protein PHG23_01255, partial [Candidatus Pacebacteria bacterium]|nr:hypothetical protein [Candidatus Paceibacterota bacterium]
MNKNNLLKITFSVFLGLAMIFGSAPQVFATIATTSVTLDGGSTTIKNPGDTISATVYVSTSGFSNHDWRSTAWKIGSGSFVCVDTPDHTDHGSYNETFNIT